MFYGPCGRKGVKDIMRKSHNEITRVTADEDKFIIEKRESDINKRNIIAILSALIFFSIFCYFWVKERITDRTTIIIIYSVAYLMVLAILGSILNIRFLFVLEKSKGIIRSRYVFYKILSLNNERINIQDADSISLVRFNISSVYLDQPSIRKTLSIFNKYGILLFNKDYSYERLIGFNNYLEANQAFKLIQNALKITGIDSTAEEFKDEDEYISQYIRHKETVKEIIKEKT
jgi:hypothetical protein